MIMLESAKSPVGKIPVCMFRSKFFKKLAHLTKASTYLC